MAEADGDCQLVTELWLEPQTGHVTDKDSWLQNCALYSDIHQKVSIFSFLS